MAEARQIIEALRMLSNPKIVDGMKRLGINGTSMLGVPMPAIRTIAKETGRDHRIAAELWKTNIHEARILAALVDEPGKVTGRQMDAWAGKFNSWDLCDQCCLNLFDKTPHAHRKAVEWSRRDEEFVKRAGFALMAVLSVHDKKAKDEAFAPFLERIESEADDGRNFVKKAVNWALRQIGKRNESLRVRAVAVARRLKKTDSAAARWVASDALRELTDGATIERLRIKSAGPRKRTHE